MTLPTNSIEALSTDAAPPTMLTARDVAKRLGVAKTALYGWLAKGDIPHHRLGRIIRIREADLDAFLEKHRVEMQTNSPHRYGRYPQA